MDIDLNPPSQVVNGQSKQLGCWNYSPGDEYTMSRTIEFRKENKADFDVVASLHDTAFGGGMKSRIVTDIRQGHHQWISKNVQKQERMFNSRDWSANM